MTVFRIGASKLWIEGDAQGIILTIFKVLGVNGHTTKLLQDIKIWPGVLEEWKVSHILQEGNAPAYFMTVGESKGIAAEYSLENLPSESYNLIVSNLKSCGVEIKCH